jgi:hypothetical protein
MATFLFYQWFQNFSGERTTLNILVLRKGQNIDFPGIKLPLELISRTTSGPRSRLWELLYSIPLRIRLVKLTNDLGLL